jgi:hypothetical protein
VGKGAGRPWARGAGAQAQAGILRAGARAGCRVAPGLHQGCTKWAAPRAPWRALAWCPEIGDAGVDADARAHHDHDSAGGAAADQLCNARQVGGGQHRLRVWCLHAGRVRPGVCLCVCRGGESQRAPIDSQAQQLAQPCAPAAGGSWIVCWQPAPTTSPSLSRPRPRSLCSSLSTLGSCVAARECCKSTWRGACWRVTRRPRSIQRCRNHATPAAAAIRARLAVSAPAWGV